MSQPAPGMIPYGTRIIHSEPVDIAQPIDHDNIRGKTILITGGASGFGAACFREWASHGANVIIGDINERAGTELVAQMRQTTGNQNHYFISLDVTSWQSQAAFFKQAARLSPHGGIDHVMANAGVADAPEQLLFEDPPDYATMDNSPPPPKPAMRTLDINLNGVLYTTHLAISYLSRNPGSEKCQVNKHSGTRDRHLILVSSIAGLAGLPGQPLYAAAKHGVVGLFRTLRLTIPLKRGVRVNMINPYFVDTPILGPVGAFVLAGGGMAKIESVVDATTRLVADQGIIGRALMIATKTSDEDAKTMGLERAVEDQAVWDCYADDFKQTDLFTRRIIGVTNLVTQARGWVGMWTDIGSNLSKKLSKALGY
ncbi:uncharacterized protein Z520_03815 [Fonsecaea multimorphosa CBS 102226]|uniref:Uncharacterized protein n=1 Tax=Fonsecaea multimorphosa CBS 102226 TaxID=1442371 RepID=A0A0D2KAC2_9EURO|nr:uncharacterized protein Z520_03815 [Fonsecaea multimorphosa CBS 102226]KIY00130.1 hypothetical protein Z520_03815 [Fonsecaea multimorphosa CBS 102226]OAL27325.1 hypothetical protein AYO22_03600 [Fonsecaea multimorphosa]